MNSHAAILILIAMMATAILISFGWRWASRIVATAGIFVNMPIGMPHSFKNESKKPSKILIMVAPAGLENMFVEVGVPLAEGSTSAQPPTREEIAKLIAIAPKYGIEILLPHP